MLRICVIVLLCCVFLTSCQSKPEMPDISEEMHLTIAALFKEAPIPTPTPIEAPKPISDKQENSSSDALPSGFSYVTDINGSILVDLRYAGLNNFTGFVVDGYYSSTAAILTTPTANALSKVQSNLEKEGYGLLIYDAYRPKKASGFFVEWAKTDDIRNKEKFYPGLDKNKLHSLGYLAEGSDHSRGIAVDLTIVELSTGIPIDMGGSYDFFDEVSWHGNKSITAEQSANRKKLKDAMAKSGFESFGKEWWHYSFNDKSLKNASFDFDVVDAPINN